jgi:hypothetical protein
MIDRVRREWGSRHSASFVDGDVLQIDALQRALRQCVEDGEAVLLLGTAFAWVTFLDACEQMNWSVALPPGSRLFETGGYKGRSRHLSRLELRQAIEQRLGIAATHVVSEYGMTELASQCYTLNLRLALLDGAASPDDVWSYPAWLRPRVLQAQQELPADLAGAAGPGLMVHQDLGNRASVASLLTADVGTPSGASFLLEGRAPVADLRGCGLTMENLQASGDAT